MIESFSQKKIERAPIMMIRVGSETIPSIRHVERNEDAILKLEAENVYGIFDGMGGTGGGREAAEATRNFVLDRIKNKSDETSPEEVANELAQLLIEANEEILRLQQQGEYPDMGTTASLVKILSNKEGTSAVVANVGDSRVYLLRANTQKLEQVTLDDNYMRSTIEDETKARALQAKFNNIDTADDISELTPEEKEFLDNRNYITQALGVLSNTPNTYIVNLEHGDKLLISSDGVHDNLTDTEIQELLARSTEPEKLSESLVEMARERSRLGKKQHPRSKADDISAIVLELPDDEDSEKTLRMGAEDPFPELTKEITKTTNWKELFSVVDEYDPYPSSQGPMPAQIVKERIRAYLKGEGKITDISRIGNLREHVLYLKDAGVV